MENYIVIFANPQNSKYIIILCTNNIQAARDAINSNEFKPYPFSVFAAYQCGLDMSQKELDLLINKWFPERHTVDMRAGKESIQFLDIPREKALKMLQLLAKISGTEQKIELNKNFSRETVPQTKNDYVYVEKDSRFRFSECGIKVGEIVEYKFDRSIKATVYDDTHVLYNGRLMNLTSVARSVSGRDSKNGPRDFLYMGRTLAELRKERSAK